MATVVHSTALGDANIGDVPSLDFDQRDRSGTFDSMARADIVVALVLTAFFVLLLSSLIVARVCLRRQRKESHRRKNSQDIEGKLFAWDRVQAQQTSSEKQAGLNVPKIVVTSQTTFNDNESSHEEKTCATKDITAMVEDTPEGVEDPSTIMAKVANIATGLRGAQSVESLDVDIKSVRSKRMSVFVDSWADIQAHCAESFELEFPSASEDNLTRMAAEHNRSTTSVFDDEPSADDSFPQTPKDAAIDQGGAAEIVASSSTSPYDSLFVFKRFQLEEEGTDSVTASETQTSYRKARSAVRDMPSFLSYGELHPEAHA